MENFKENTAFKLNDGHNYWVIKRLEMENIIFYYTIKMVKPAEVVIFADGDELKIVDDPEIINIISAEVLKTVETL